MKHWGKKVLAWGCAVTCLAAVMPANMVIPNDNIIGKVYAAEEEAGIDIPYTAVTVGDVVTYTLNGYTEAEVASTKWYSGGTLETSATGVTGYTVSANDEEAFIKVEVTMKDGAVYTDSIYYSELPVLYIDSEAAYDSFVVKTEDYTETVMNLVAKGYETEELYSGDAGMRLRGNSTSALAKKPFKVKLDSKADLLGMGKNKHWVLLANAIDVTNMRNKLILDFSADIGAEFASESENVTMIYNGEYMGVYQLCEQVRVGDERVEIYNWEDAAEEVADVYLKALQADGLISKTLRKEIASDVEDELKADYSWMSDDHVFTSPTLAALGIGLTENVDLDDYIDWEDLELPEATGGALIEMDFYEGAAAALLTAYQQPYYFNTPENGETFTALYDYMKEYIQTVEYALHDTDFTYDNTDAHYVNTGTGNYDWWQGKRVNVTYSRYYNFISQYTGMHYSELLDMDSAVVNFLVCEFSRNWDSMKNSAFMYKDIDGKLKMGPSWDYDWAWGNSMYNIDTDYPEGWQTTDEYFANEQYYQTVQWNRMLVRDPYFLQRVYEKYHEIRETVIEDIIKEGGLLDTYYEEYKNASHANDEKWGGSMGTGAGTGYDVQYEEMKDFILTRVAWLDEQFTSLETLRTSIGYYVKSSSVSVDSVDTGSKDGYTVITASTTESIGTQISFQVNGTYMKTVDITDGVAVLEVPDSALTEDMTQANVVQVRVVNSDGNYLTKVDGTTTGVYTNAVSNYAVFDKETCLVLEEDADCELKEVDDTLLVSTLTVGTTVSEVLAMFVNEDIRVVDAEGNTVADTAAVATGYRVQLVNGTNVAEEAAIVIPGDVYGDGRVDVLDMEAIQKDILQIAALDTPYYEAARNMDGLEDLSVLDMEAIQKLILGLE